VIKRAGVVVAVGIAVVMTNIATPTAQRGGGRYQQQSYSGNVRYDGRFAFVRVSYPYWGGRGAPWAHDYPRGETHFLKIWSELTSAPSHTEESSVMSLSDPEIYKFPIIYMCEPGYWQLASDQEAKALRDYLEKGGFMIFDDFRNGRGNPREWGNFEYQMTRVLPEGRWVDLTPDHPIFHSFYEINSFSIIPQAYDEGPPSFRGWYQDNDPKKRLMVIAAFNTDLSEFWEFADTGYHPMAATNEAYKIGINLFMYGLTH
jgi:hypothetical protein